MDELGVHVGGVEQFADEPGATLERQRHVRDAPAVVLITHPVGHRHADLVEEQFGELGRPLGGDEGAHIDARRVHRHDQPRDALVLRRVGIGAHEHLAVVGHHRVRGPDLLSRDHVVVTVAHRAGAQRREIAARAGFGESLAPRVLAGEDAAEVVGLLCVGALGDDRRARVHLSHESDAHVGCLRRR